MIWLIIAFVQIVTESFPISSSGHVVLITRFLHLLGCTIPRYKMIDEMTALPTLIVIGVCYGSSMLQKFLSCTWYQIINFWLGIGIATVPTVVVYFLTHTWSIKQSIPLWIGFAVSMLLLFSTKYAPIGSSSIDMRALFLIGLAQAIALMIPGLSRMAITYATGCWLGIASINAFALSLAFECPLLLGALLKMTLLHPQSWYVYTRVDWLSTVLLAMAPAMIGLRYMIILAFHNKLWYVGYYLFIPLIFSCV